jgi:methionyl-tRNA formyltransferase
MKIVLLSVNICSIPTCQFLMANHTLQAVVSTAENNPYIQHFEQLVAGFNIPFKKFSKAELGTSFKQMLEELKPDVVLSFAYTYKIPSALFNIPKFGFYNVHYSLLPRYRGRCPVFWQIKNGDAEGGISIHQVTAEFDTGPILMQKPVQVIPGSNHGIMWGGLSLQAVAVVSSALEKLAGTGNTMLLGQDEADATEAPTPQQKDFAINWENQTAAEIDALVNACNPDFGGAATLFRNQQLRLFEVTLAELNSPGESAPGTIVYADINHGIFVACKNHQFLRINIFQSPEGIMTGFKLAALGIRAGERFDTIPG